MMKRRTALGLMGVSMGMAAAGGALAAGKTARNALDLADKRQFARAFRKIAYSLDDSVTFWWLNGTRYGVVDSVATPFWDMYVGAWFTTRTLDDEHYEVVMAGANFYTPPNSTDLLQFFTNPYTGQVVPVKYAPPKASVTRMGLEGGSAFGGNIPGMKTTVHDAAGPSSIEGDEVIIRGDMILNAQPLDPSGGVKPLVVQDWSTYVAKLADVANPKVQNAPASQSFIDVLTWPAWLQMGDQRGSYVSRCYGRKAFSYAQMPATWRKLFAQAMPEVAKDPAAVLKVR